MWFGQRVKCMAKLVSACTEIELSTEKIDTYINRHTLYAVGCWFLTCPLFFCHSSFVRFFCAHENCQCTGKPNASYAHQVEWHNKVTFTQTYLTCVLSILFPNWLTFLQTGCKMKRERKKTRNERNISYLPFSQRYASNTKHKNHLILNHFVVFLYKIFLLALVIHHFGRRSCTPSKIKWVVLAIKWTFARTIHKFSTTI